MKTVSFSWSSLINLYSRIRKLGKKWIKDAKGINVIVFTQCMTQSYDDAVPWHKNFHLLLNNAILSVLFVGRKRMIRCCLEKKNERKV